MLVLDLLDDLAHDQHFQLAALRVEVHLDALLGFHVAGVRLGEGLLERLDQLHLVDVAGLRHFTQRVGKVEFRLGHLTLPSGCVTGTHESILGGYR